MKRLMNASPRLPWRNRARFMALYALTLFSVTPAMAQSWPVKPIRVLVGFPAGGVVDVMARTITEKMSQTLGQPILIENRPGAGSNIAVAAVHGAAPDGYTWLITSNFLFVNPALDATVKWKSSDFIPVARYALSPSFLLVPASAPWNTVREFVDHARKNPGLRSGDGGPGTTQTLATQALSRKNGFTLESVYYKGGTTHGAGPRRRAASDDDHAFFGGDLGRADRPHQGAGHHRGHSVAFHAQGPHHGRGGFPRSDCGVLVRHSCARRDARGGDQAHRRGGRRRLRQHRGSSPAVWHPVARRRIWSQPHSASMSTPSRAAGWPS